MNSPLKRFNPAGTAGGTLSVISLVLPADWTDRSTHTRRHTHLSVCELQSAPVWQSRITTFQPVSASVGISFNATLPGPERRKKSGRFLSGEAAELYAQPGATRTTNNRLLSALILRIPCPPPLHHHHHHLMLQDLALGPDTVDYSMETLASTWAHDPSDLSDLGEKRHEPSPEWESHCVFNTTPPAGLTWTDQLSPHLQRNKQLQDTLLQREEELARLQEENNKLREFLNSSFVRNLEQKAKKLTADGKRKLKRNLAYLDDFCGTQRVASQQISKRVCRNLTAEFCSESSETSAYSEPNLDLWVLRTLGLKDRDTIDTSSESSSEYSLRSLVYNTAVNPSSSPECNLNSSFSPPVTPSTHPSVHSCRQRATDETSCRYSAAECQEANCENNSESAPNCPVDFAATGVTTNYKVPDTVTRTYSIPSTSQLARAELCSLTALNQVQTLEGNPPEHHMYRSSLQESQTLSHDTVQFSPPAEKVFFSPMLSSGPNQLLKPTRGSIPTSSSQPSAMTHTPHSRTDLAFSMSLSPSSSVKTHSFPQGQAFVRKDLEGRWNFTWVPRQGP